MSSPEMQKQFAPATAPPSAPVVERIKQAYGVKTLSELAACMNAPEPTVKGWSQRDSVPLERLVQAAKDRECSLDWLVGLTADPTASHVRPSSLASSPANGLALPMALHAAFASKEINPVERSEQISKVSGRSREIDFVVVPRLRARASAGAGVTNEEEALVGQIAFEASWMRKQFGRAGEGFALVDVEGSSMEPTFFDGATILVDQHQRSIDSGGIFVLRRDSEILVKRVQRLLSGVLQVISDNQAFYPEVLTAEDEVQLEVIGRVVWPRSR